MKVPSTYRILKEKALDENGGQHWVDWAVEMMQAGYESDDLYILAGLSAPYNQFELQPLMDKVLQDVKLDYSNGERVINNYIGYLIAATIDHPEIYFKTLTEIDDIYVEYDLHGDIETGCYELYLLYNAKEDFQDDHITYRWLGANAENIDSIIRQEFRCWLDIHNWNMQIVPAQPKQAQEVYTILCKNKYDLDKQGIMQWTDDYPTLAIVENDIAKGHMYCAMLDDRCVGVITINEEQEPEYAAISWTYNGDKALTIHRLAVDPFWSGQGKARLLMDFAEQYGRAHGYTSVRLDAYSDNKRVLRFYEARGYEKRGEVFFAGRQSPFYCYEKALQP